MMFLLEIDVQLDLRRAWNSVTSNDDYAYLGYA